MLTEEEKKLLKNKINASVTEYYNKRKKRRLVYYYISVAAAITIMFFSIKYTNTYQNSSALKNYVDVTGTNIDKDGDVKLVLNDKEEVQITEEAPSITYSSSGGEVTVNNSKIVEQSLENTFNTIIVPYGKRIKITLSEGTKVWLNSGSRLTYPVVFNGDKREVHLIGEAIFDVMHNNKQPFYVVTDDYDIKVLGTVFNVSSYSDDDYTSTALERGSVMIKYKGSSFFWKSSMKITPGTLAIYNNKTKKMSSNRVDVTKYMSWRDGKFIFKKQRMDVIVKKLSRYYNVTILIESEELKKQTFSGHLDLKDSVEKVMEVLKQSTDLRYKNENGKFVIN
ncbi:FecR family protein [Aquimarina sp. MAR_2010_214]|uniref:FecR family protein n=1 Tax=Aquimarina sp. MAR_2010_214 TaxID=1250026 RepID=UPI000C701D23|nr:FecR domain-containing protein [Aquimarina sp. MAR_2010_214]PKV52905.1 FecR family protein [Aquimarina sp. MAR_2010_214]